MWAIALLSFAVLWMARVVDLEMDAAAGDARGFRGRELALSGVALGLHPGIERTDPLLRREFPDGAALRVEIRGENGRLNINRLLLENDRQTLKNLFRLWGLPVTEVDPVLDALLDYVDADDFKRLNGAERADYEKAGIEGMPANRPFRSVEEMAGVAGMDRIASLRPDWQEAFTIFGDGKLDINEASSELLQAVTGLAPEQVEVLLLFRRGQDGLEFTLDDQKVESLDQVRTILPMSNEQFELFSRRAGTTSSVKRIESTGSVADLERSISVVAAQQDGAGGPPKIFLWSEK